MALTCEKCGKMLHDKTNRFCRTHALKLLDRMERDEYLVPLSIRTIGGFFRVSTQRFLTLNDLEPGGASPSQPSLDESSASTASPSRT